MDWFVLLSVGIVALMAGFWTGRSLQWQLAETEDGISAERGMYAGESLTAEGGAALPGGGLDGAFRMENLTAEGQESAARGGSRHAKGVRRIPLGHEIGSPVSGTVSCASENGQSVLRIAPDRGRVYAPAAGRITRIYPMGCAMTLRTDFGAELYLRAGSGADEMQSGCYRCCVMEREVVRKGALLLEYDLEGLHRDGAGTEVTLRMEHQDKTDAPLDVTVTNRPYVRAGDCLMRIRP